jgi:tripartite-type tricarboxylate transporter receptor subunit TctC
MLALIGGQIDMMFVDIGTGLQHIKSGKIKQVGISTKERSAAFPDMAPLGESVLRGFNIFSCYAWWVRKGTPTVAIDNLAKSVQEV